MGYGSQVHWHDPPLDQNALDLQLLARVGARAPNSSGRIPPLRILHDPERRPCSELREGLDRPKRHQLVQQRVQCRERRDDRWCRRQFVDPGMCVPRALTSYLDTRPRS